MDFVKKYSYVIAGVICMVVMGSLYMWQRMKPTTVIQPVSANENAVMLYNVDATLPLHEVFEPGRNPIKVHITGEVVNPGVYELIEGDRVEDALAAAGGFTDEAEKTRINLAARIMDEMQIIIPHIDDPEAEIFTAQAPNQGVLTSSGLININNATQTELETLPGIGPVLARGIIDFREQNGSFNVIDDIKKVSRIGDATFDKIKDKITVGG